MTIVLNGTTGITNDGGYTGDGIVFSDTTPANTLVTNTSGNVGIGASSPSAKLDVRALSGGVMFNVQESDSGNNRRVRISNSGTVNTIESTTGVGSTQLAFAVDGPERARIDSSGNLLVGTTNTDPTGNNVAGVLIAPSYINVNRTADVAGYFGRTSDGNVLLFRRSGGNTGSVSVTSTTTAYNTSSDYRLKHNIAPMAGALAKVAALKPVTYKWNADGSDGQGFIAHELQAVVPDAVVGEKDAVDADGNPQYQGIDTSFLVATLTAAIQEQQAIITALTARVEALEGTQP